MRPKEHTKGELRGSHFPEPFISHDQISGLFVSDFTHDTCLIEEASFRFSAMSNSGCCAIRSLIARWKALPLLETLEVFCQLFPKLRCVFRCVFQGRDEISSDGRVQTTA